jgi:NTP pyrophosphatase (non-canonical NTP hydrolase)
MFAIGDKVWPGISKLIEECGEVVQVCGKLLGTGGKEVHWEGSNLRERLVEELGDLLGAIRFVAKWNKIDVWQIEHRAELKLRRFESWHAAGDPTVEIGAETGARNVAVGKLSVGCSCPLCGETVVDLEHRCPARFQAHRGLGRGSGR